MRCGLRSAATAACPAYSISQQRALALAVRTATSRGQLSSRFLSTGRGSTAYISNSRYPTSTTPVSTDLSSNTQDTPVACPYEPGSTLTVLFAPEGSTTCFPIEVDILKAFTPFTICEALLVAHNHHSLPRKFVIKFADPRFSDPDLHARGYRSPWSAAHDAMFEAGIQNAKRGTWPNFWQRLGGTQTPWAKRPYVEEDDEPMETWVEEMDCWDGILNTVQHEAAVYRVLRPLQGTDVPILYGSCSFAPPDVYPGSLVTRVNGLCMEFIDGARVDHMKIDLDVSEAEARRISPSVLDMMRRVRQFRVLHNDIYARNILIHRDSFRPVLIDFGGASLQPANETLEQWTETVASVNEVNLVRRILKNSGWHNPSPWPKFMECRNGMLNGHGMVNASIEELRPDWRDEYYERIEDAPPNETRVDSEGKEYRWQPLRWRIRKDVKKFDTDFEWRG
ncbi:hypothetical protein BV25DRAFT_1529149 [Artomyces pyxidatus]|uniref:Uncharacterized protein n=1 Tax=Artomyces pyxidatus TaxID=48021 RepID=A0ACB8TD21_9AGAM|nr:hypothetical protein BV25DRAFT_1529149 [Artomyces pyxidatus]